MSQQEFMETPQHYEEAGLYKTPEVIERTAEYPVWEQHNEFVDRYFYGEKLQPQPGKKSAAWSLIPLFVLLFLIAGGAFGLTAVFHTMSLPSSPWSNDDFVPRHGGWYHHPPHCQVIADPDHQTAPIAIQGDDSDRIIIIQGQYACGRP